MTIAYIPLNDTDLAIVDLDDVPMLLDTALLWNHEPGRYARSSIKTLSGRKVVTMHRAVLGFPLGDIDHVNADKLDNRRSNLRVCSKSQNECNKPPRGRWKGVYWNKWNRAWASQIMLKGKRKHLGYFADPIDAATAYNFGAAQIHGEFAFYNTTEQPWLDAATKGDEHE